MSKDLDNWPLIRVYHRTGVQWRHARDLVFLEAELNYTWLHWRDGWRVLLPRTLKQVEAQLPAAYFIRLHRQFVVNRLFVDSSQLLADGSKVHLTIEGVCLPVSRRRRSQTRLQLSAHRAIAPIDR